MVVAVTDADPAKDPGYAAGRDAIDGALSTMLIMDPGELVVGWILLGATRSVNGGGQVVRVMSDPTMPPWQVKGILAEASDDIDFDQWHGHDEGDGDGG